MKYITSIIILSLTVLFYTSCAKEEDKESSSSSSGSVTSSSGATASGSITVGSATASGTYSSVCVPFSGSGLSSDTQSVGNVFIITGNNSAQTETNYYTDSSCGSLGGYFVSHLDNITIGSASGENYQVDYTLTKYSIKPKTEATKTYFESTYTSSTFSIDSITEITYGFGMKNLIYVSGSTLKVGSGAFNSYPTAADSEYTKN